jgi:hypothetical protein
VTARRPLRPGTPPRRNPYSPELLEAYRYLRNGIIPRDYGYLFDDWLHRTKHRKPRGFNPDYPVSYIDEHVGSPLIAEFADWLKEDGAWEDVARNPRNAPAYMHFHGPSLLPESTWLVHFTRDAENISRNGFLHGEEEVRWLAATTTHHAGHLPSEPTPGYNLAYPALSSDAEEAASKGWYGEEAVFFQTAGVAAHHHGDRSRQVIFWGPDVRRFTPAFERSGEWVLLRNPDERVLKRGGYLDIATWVVAHADTYRRSITWEVE